MVESTRFKNEEGSCYLLVVSCASPSDRQHKQGRRFIAIFLFSVALRFKNEEGSCYLLVVPCANPSDRQHKRGRRFIAIFLCLVSHHALRTRKVHVIFLSFRVQILQIDNTSEEEASLQCSCLASHQ